MDFIIRNTHKNYTQMNNHSAQNSKLSLEFEDKEEAVKQRLLQNLDGLRSDYQSQKQSQQKSREDHRTLARRRARGGKGV